MRSHAVAVPGADLLRPNVYDDMMNRAISARHIGQGVIDGIECEHLAFRAQDVDWQLWVQTGANPIPRKLVITSKAVGGAPEAAPCPDRSETELYWGLHFALAMAHHTIREKERLTKLSDGKCDLDDVAAIIERVVAVSVMALTGGETQSKPPALPAMPHGRLTRQDL